MPRTFPGDSSTYYRLASIPVLDADKVNVLVAVAGGVVTLTGGTPTVVRDDGGAIVQTIQSSLSGLIPEYLVAMTDPLAQKAYVDFPNDNIPPQAWPLEFLEAMNLVLARATTIASGSTIDRVEVTLLTDAALPPAASFSGGVFRLQIPRGLPGTTATPTEAQMSAALTAYYAANLGQPVAARGSVRIFSEAGVLVIEGTGPTSTTVGSITVSTAQPATPPSTGKFHLWGQLPAGVTP